MEEAEKVPKKLSKSLTELRAEVTQSKGGSEKVREGRAHEVVQMESGGGGGGTDAATRQTAVEDAEVSGETSGHQTLVPAPANVRGSTSATSDTVSSAQHLAEVGADNEKGLWESFVVEFQEEMQDYRTMVLAFAEGEEDCDLENAERRLRSIGQRLVQTAQDTKADATIKSRARQLLQYVSSYCQSHGREDLNAEFVAYIASCDEG